MKKAVILTAVMAFAMMLCFGVQSARADGVLFPYFTSGGGDLTFIQIINTKEDDTTDPENQTLHYTYVYNTDEETCVHYDDDGDTSENDILFYEVTDMHHIPVPIDRDELAPALAGQLLFGDITSTSPALTVSPAWGYLVVDNDYWGDEDEGTIQGQEIVVNTDNLYAYTLNGINDPDDSGQNEFHSHVDDGHWLSFLPEDYASTVWYLFQIDGDDITDPDPNEYGIDECTDINYCYVEVGSADDGIYNNNESLKSGTPMVYPGCIYEDDPADAITGIPGWQSNDFFFSLEEMLTGAQYNAVKGTGGWFDVAWYNWGYPYKIITSNVFGSTMTNMVYEPHVDGSSYLSYTK